MRTYLMKRTEKTDVTGSSPGQMASLSLLAYSGIKIKFLHPIPYQTRPGIGPIPILLAPQCLSVSEADSIDLRNHSISLCGSHKLSTKEKSPHFTHTTKEKNRLQFHPPPTQLLWLGQTIPVLYPLLSLLVSHGHCSLARSLARSDTFDRMKI